MRKLHLPYYPSSHTYQASLDLVYSNVWEPASICAWLGNKYYVVCTNAYSRYTCLYHLVNKSQVFLAFLQLQYKAMIELKTAYKNKALQFENGKE